MDRMSGEAILEAIREVNERRKKGGEAMTTTKRPPGDEEWRRLKEEFEFWEDLTVGWEKPKAEKPPEDLTAKRLREAMDLGVKMAEADALLMLTRKAREVRAAEIERRRPYLIINNTLH
jgi:hypothetical protein